MPFASAHALFNLSKLALWWLRLGIGIERIKPGHPEQNGRHERMHLTLKKEATKPAVGNFLQQQARFDKFIEVFNNERPHEALGMKCPADVYQASPRPYQGLPDIDYPFHDRTIVVTHCGRICLGRKKINFSQVFAGQAVGIKEVQDDIWLVKLALWIMIWDTSIWRLGCLNRSKIRSAQKCYPCSRYKVLLAIFPPTKEDPNRWGSLSFQQKMFETSSCRA